MVGVLRDRAVTISPKNTARSLCPLRNALLIPEPSTWLMSVHSWEGEPKQILDRPIRAWMKE